MGSEKNINKNLTHQHFSDVPCGTNRTIVSGTNPTGSRDKRDQMANFGGCQKGGFPKKGGFGECTLIPVFRSGGTCERTLVLVFVPGDHPNGPSFQFSFWGNVRQNRPFGKTTLLATPE